MDNNVREVLEPIAILGSLSTGVYFFVRTMTDYILKKKMIEKGFVNDETQAIFRQHTAENKYASLKWGLIMLAAGLSLIILEYIDVRPESPLPYGLITVSVSLGFLVYYFIVKKEIHK
jgi:hypothetical protein